MKGDKTQTRPERRTPPVTKRRTHLKKELRTPNSKLFGEKHQKKVDTYLGLPFQVSTNMSTLYQHFPGFPGECIATFLGTIDPKTANMSQFLQLGPVDFDPDLGYVRYFWEIDSANNHSHISKPHPLNNTDTLGGRFPWTVIQPLVNTTNFWNAPPIFLPTHEHHL